MPVLNWQKVQVFFFFFHWCLFCRSLWFWCPHERRGAQGLSTLPFSLLSPSFFFFLNFFLGLFIYLFVYLFMAVLGLRFCARAFSSCGKWGPLFIVLRGPLIIAASLIEEHRLQTRRLSNCGSRVQLLRGTRGLPRPGLEPVSPALAGRFSTTAPPGKPLSPSFYQWD